MSFIVEYRALAEFIYFVSNSFLAIGLFIAISQLKQLKKEASVRISRESTSITLSLLERKLKEIESAKDSVYSQDFWSEMPDFEGEIKGYFRSGVCAQNDWLTSLESDDAHSFVCAISDYLNELETLSQYILSGLVDEELSFKLQGPYIVKCIKEFEPYVAAYRDSEEDPLFEYIVKLYVKWSQMQELDHLKNEHMRLSKTLRSKVRPESVVTIGK
jgi:hypothetical protein